MSFNWFRRKTYKIHPSKSLSYGNVVSALNLAAERSKFIAEGPSLYVDKKTTSLIRNKVDGHFYYYHPCAVEMKLTRKRRGEIRREKMTVSFEINVDTDTKGLSFPPYPYIANSLVHNLVLKSGSPFYRKVEDWNIKRFTKIFGDSLATKTDIPANSLFKPIPPAPSPAGSLASN